MNRNELRKHSTRNVILRMDYIPLTDDFVDKINISFGEKFISEDFGFSQFLETFINNIDLQINDINDPTIQDSNNFLDIKNNSTRIKSYEYLMETDGDVYLKLVFNKYFIAVEILQDLKYCKFEDYKNIFESAINTIRDVVGASLRITRFGFRKLNDLFVNVDANLSNFINIKYFDDNCDDLLGSKMNSIITEKRYTFCFDNYSINLLTHVSKGNLNDSVVKRIAFDIDFYSSEFDFLKNVFDDFDKKLIDSDNYIFKIFSNLLCPAFLEFYKDENEEYDNLIMGVMNNE